MKKSILAIAVAATMAAPAVMAAPTVYGNVHLSLNSADNDVVGASNELSMSSNTSSIGVKGSEDLGDGMKAIYKIEFGVGIADGPSTQPDSAFNADGDIVGAPHEGSGTLSRRDQFVGIKGGMGTVKFGSMSSNYKQMGGKVDPLYRTPLEARGFLKTQSNLHGGAGVNRGRQTNTVQYSSPKMGGIQLVANTTFSGSSEESMGVGIRWSNKNILAYVDMIDSQLDATGSITLAQAQAEDPAVTAAGFNTATKTEGATKFGVKYSTKLFSAALQFESAEDRTGADYMFAAGTYNVDKNNQIVLTYGTQSVKVAAGGASEDTSGIAVAYNHKLSKMTNVYVGYGAKSSDEKFDVAAGDSKSSADESMMTFGIRAKF